MYEYEPFSNTQYIPRVNEHQGQLAPVGYYPPPMVQAPAPAYYPDPSMSQYVNTVGLPSVPGLAYAPEGYGPDVPISDQARAQFSQYLPHGAGAQAPRQQAPRSQGRFPVSHATPQVLLQPAGGHRMANGRQAPAPPYAPVSDYGAPTGRAPGGGGAPVVNNGSGKGAPAAKKPAAKTAATSGAVPNAGTWQGGSAYSADTPNNFRRLGSQARIVGPPTQDRRADGRPSPAPNYALVTSPASAINVSEQHDVGGHALQAQRDAMTAAQAARLMQATQNATMQAYVPPSVAHHGGAYNEAAVSNSDLPWIIQQGGNLPMIPGVEHVPSAVGALRGRFSPGVIRAGGGVPASGGAGKPLTISPRATGYTGLEPSNIRYNRVYRNQRARTALGNYEAALQRSAELDASGQQWLSNLPRVQTSQYRPSSPSGQKVWSAWDIDSIPRVRTNLPEGMTVADAPKPPKTGNSAPPKQLTLFEGGGSNTSTKTAPSKTSSTKSSGAKTPAASNLAQRFEAARTSVEAKPSRRFNR